MNAEDWTVLNRLLDEVLDVPPDERPRWIEALAPEFGPLKPRLRSLLAEASAVAAVDYLGALPALSGTQARDGEGVESTSDAGTVVGPYRLVREIGMGGMGTVWLAERTDGILKRPVALKLPRGAWPRAAFGERIAREREILATLNHRNIARLYDGGVAADGQPYLALEYVEGQSIDAYASGARLNEAALLRLFLQVARAVAHAHAKLVVHRDIKPSNILVTAEGEVKLLDFGIAKLLDQGRASETQLTQWAGRALTPGYASPEQVAGEPLTVATDVYSLAAVLHELLTGERLSASTSPSRRALGGDLGTIVLKALKANPDERYATVDAFADDVERYLDGRPVVARPDSTWYRASKFVGRNRVAVAAAAAVLVAVIAGAGVAVWQARRALAEQRRAEEVKEFIASLFSAANIDAQENRPMPVLDLLKQAKDRMATVNAGPEVRVELLNILGSSLLSLSDTDTTEAVMNQAVDEGTRGLGATHPLTLRARLVRNWVHMYRGRTKDMRAELDQIIPAMERDPERFREGMITAMRQRAAAALDEGQSVEAETIGKETLARAEASLGPRHPETLHALSALVYSYRANDKYAEALQTAERLYRTSLEVYGSDRPHQNVRLARAHYGRALGDMGRLQEALEHLTIVLKETEALHGPSSRATSFQLNGLVRFQLSAGLIKEAIAAAERGLALTAERAPGSFPHKSASNGYASALLAARRGAENLPRLTQAVADASSLMKPTHPDVLNTRANLVLGLAFAGRHTDAVAAGDLLLADMRRAGLALPRPLHFTGAVKRLAGDPRGALPLQREALSLVAGKPTLEPEHASVLAELGVTLVDLNQLDEAVEILERARASFAQLGPRMIPRHADALVALARAKLQTGRVADAVSLLHQADAFWRDFDAKSRWAGEARAWLQKAEGQNRRLMTAREQ